MWLLLFTLLIFTLLAYIVLIAYYRYWFVNIPHFIPQPPQRFTSFSIVIPARNEAANIRACLDAVLHQDYPTRSFEIIVVNDHSTDNTVEIVASLQEEYHNLKLLHLHNLPAEQLNHAFKKRAISMAIDSAAGNWIITTDADCLPTKQWLSLINACIQQQQPVFIAAPVKYINTGSLVSVFQCLDFLSLQGITAAAVHHKFHSMCNGANLAYSKQVFYAVDGFKGIDHVASGDDMLLMHKIYKKHPDKVAFLMHEDAVVQTETMPTWRSFINQRIRWASKADSYDDKRIFGVLLLVYLLNVLLLVMFVAALLRPVILLAWLVAIAVKTCIELSFMVPVASFFREKPLLIWFPFMQPLHILYTVVAGWLGKFGSYRWKERTVR